jgi:hypothetical protein
MPRAIAIATHVSRGHHRCCRRLPCLTQPLLPLVLGCAAAARPLRERHHRFPAHLGSVAVARSWWSAAVGRQPRGEPPLADRTTEGTAAADRTVKGTASKTVGVSRLGGP